MLKGFHTPLTPKGMSTLNPSPPWHYSSDFIDPSAIGPRPIVCLQHVPDLRAGHHDKPLVHRLLLNIPHDTQIANAWMGRGELELPVCHGEEMSDLGPRRVGKSMRASMSYIVDDVKQLEFGPSS